MLSNFTIFTATLRQLQYVSSFFLLSPGYGTFTRLSKVGQERKCVVERRNRNTSTHTWPEKEVTVDFPFVPVTAKTLMFLGNTSAAKSNSDITCFPCTFTRTQHVVLPSVKWSKCDHTINQTTSKQRKVIKLTDWSKVSIL